MRVIPEKLAAHLAGGATSLCRCWRLSRRDGVVMGFTDHDRDINFDGVVFSAGTGLDAAAIYQTTGLSVDNSQAVGALSDFGLDDVDIRAGRYDGAEVLAWLVNWRDVSQRLLQFRGSIGEIRRNGGVFEAELRGLSEALNQPEGRAYHKNCSAVLGDGACKFDVSQPGYFADAAVLKVVGRGKLVFAGLVDFAEGWFEKGLVRILGGVGTGLSSVIQADRFLGGERLIDLWQELPVDLTVGDLVRLEAGCDKRELTCRLKFHNFLNYRGFPHIPGEDWAMSYPTKSGLNNGGKLL
jgi:uncharacterized phage protein (TIGR02218 family)